MTPTLTIPEPTASEEAIHVGDVVQLDPEKTLTTSLAACFMVITEIKSWGVQGYVTVPERNGVAYYRAETGSFVKIGKARWVTTA